jgi:hypothetical protein
LEISSKAVRSGLHLLTIVSDNTFLSSNDVADQIPAIPTAREYDVSPALINFVGTFIMTQGPFLLRLCNGTEQILFSL